MEAATALAAVRLIRIPFDLLAILHLTGPLYPDKKVVENNTCLDYIIIGAGTAGCVLANRLTENPTHRVLVIEAGGDPPIETFFPPLFVLAPRSRLDWNFTSTFDSCAASSQNNYTKFTAGLGLGGSSPIDHFILSRGNKLDFDCWAKIVNDPTWNYNNVLPYFKKKETLKDPEIANSSFSIYHGTTGPTGVARQPRVEVEDILKSFGEVGNRLILDLNANINTGYTQSMYTVSDGIRQSTPFNYLTPIRHRVNLYVLRYTLATKIIFKNNRAIAVVTIRDDKVYIYRASKEIIVSAGVFNTPKLLMLSGIGPRKHLKSFNIKVRADLPVGNNFQDQVAVSLVHRLALSVLPPPPETIDLTQVPFPVILGLKALKKFQTFADYQVFSLFFAHDLPFILLTCAVIFQYRPEICDRINNKAKLHDSLYTLLTITQPESRGCVMLNSTDPFDKPKIRSGYFTNEADLINMVKYIKDFIEVGNSTYFKEIGAELIDPELEQCKDYTFGTDEYWRCYALNTAVSVYHSTSTCSMGSVVDSRLRVFKVRNLRVVDASVIPKLTNGSPYASVLMIAEKASDMIKEDADKKPTCDELCDAVLKENSNESNSIELDEKFN